MGPPRRSPERGARAGMRALSELETRWMNRRMEPVVRGPEAEVTDREQGGRREPDPMVWTGGRQEIERAGAAGGPPTPI